jgi:peptidoglycan hydrolase-like protein with peptidoglycan-binding domain
MPQATLAVGARGSDVAQLHNAILQFGIQLPDSEIRRAFFGPATRQAIQQIQQAHGLPVSGEFDEGTAAAMTAWLVARDPQAPPPATAATAEAIPPARPLTGQPAVGTNPAGTVLNRLQGHLTFDNGLPAAGVNVRLYNAGFAGQEEKLGETTSDYQGFYAFAQAIPTGQILNVQLRVVDSQNHEIPISVTTFGNQSYEVLNLAVPGNVRSPVPEYQRLAADLGNRIGGIARLVQAGEDTDRQDLVLLSESTGWDARMIALAATAVQQATPTGLGQDVLYALYRVGMPTDLQRLAMVPAAMAQKALETASQAGIIGLSDREISDAITSFQAFATRVRRATFFHRALGL